MDARTLRSLFPVLATKAYLNAGTNGPLPQIAIDAARAELDREAAEGRFLAHYTHRSELLARLRATFAGLLGGAADDVALTSGTSEGLAKVIGGLGLRPGDEIVSSDTEHPGLLGALRAARDRGIELRMAPLAEVAGAVGPRTRLVAVSHVDWTNGSIAPVEALAALDVPVVYDGAQALGAIDVDVHALDAAAYAAPGQKWLCGSEGTGCLYVAPALQERLACISPSYASFADANSGVDGELRAGAARHDAAIFATASLAITLASTELLAEHGGRERAHALATRLADALAERGRTVAPRGATTLVSWSAAGDPMAEAVRLYEAGVIVRPVPGTDRLRASVGPWSNEEDVERLLAAL